MYSLWIGSKILARTTAWRSVSGIDIKRSKRGKGESEESKESEGSEGSEGSENVCVCVSEWVSVWDIYKLYNIIDSAVSGTKTTSE